VLCYVTLACFGGRRFTVLTYSTIKQLSKILTRGVRNPMKISNMDFLKPNRTDLKIQKKKTRFRFSSLGTVFHVVSFTNSSCSMIGSAVNVFFFMPYLCTFSSESLRLPISWTNSVWKMSFLASYTLNNTQCKNRTKNRNRG